MFGHIIVFVIALVFLGFGAYIGLLAVSRQMKVEEKNARGSNSPRKPSEVCERGFCSDARQNSPDEENSSESNNFEGGPESASTNTDEETPLFSSPLISDTEGNNAEERDNEEGSEENEEGEETAPLFSPSSLPSPSPATKRKKHRKKERESDSPSPLSRINTSYSYTDSCCEFDNEDEKTHIQNSVHKQDSRYRSKLMKANSNSNNSTV